MTFHNWKLAIELDLKFGLNSDGPEHVYQCTRCNYPAIGYIDKSQHLCLLDIKGNTNNLKDCDLCIIFQIHST